MGNLFDGTIVFMRSPRKSAFRKFSFSIHKWLGVVAAVYMLVMSETGVALVFHDELADWLCPPRKVTPSAQTASLNLVKQNVERQFAEAKVTGVMMPADATGTMSAFASGADGKSIHAEVDPFTGEVLGLKQENQVLKFLRDLHFDLLNGKTGRWVNGFGALSLLIVTVSGIVVWWRGLSNWIAGFKFRFTGSFKSITWNVHSVLGAWSIPILFAWSISGLWFGFPDPFEKSLNTVFPVSSQKAEPEPVPASQKAALSDSIATLKTNANLNPTSIAKLSTTSIAKSSTNYIANADPTTTTDLDQLGATALSAVPNAKAITRIALPDKRRPSVRLWLSTRDSDGLTQVHIDPATGKVFGVAKAENPPTGDVILQWLVKLHFGNFGGVASKCVWVCLGIFPTILSLSALYLFASGRRRAHR